jgi:2,3-diketo-5-methylthio-1-phosphopentane phosphatase
MRDLANTSVFFDFDGTISTTDIGLYLLERLAGPGWHELDELYAQGAIGSRECIQRQWDCVPSHVTEAERRAVALEVPIDSAFGPLVEGLRAVGSEVTIVSDGLGYYVHDLLAPFNVPIWTNEMDFSTHTLRYPNSDPECACAACGTCKPRVIGEAAARNRTTVFIGDGTSDRHAARASDEVFAKAALADWCAAEGIAHTRFDTLDEVAAVLLPRR